MDIEGFKLQKEQIEAQKLAIFKEMAIEALKLGGQTGRRVDVKIWNDCSDSMDIIFYEKGEEAE